MTWSTKIRKKSLSSCLFLAMFFKSFWLMLLKYQCCWCCWCQCRCCWSCWSIDDSGTSISILCHPICPQSNFQHWRKTNYMVFMKWDLKDIFEIYLEISRKHILWPNMSDFTRCSDEQLVLPEQGHAVNLLDVRHEILI